MPVAHKRTIRHRKAKSTNVTHKPESVKLGQNVSKPIPSAIESAIPDQIVHETKIVKPTPILIKKTYNTSRLRKVTLTLLVCVILIGVALGWVQRDWLRQALLKHDFGPVKPAYHLNLSKESVNESKLQAALLQASLSASPAATPADKGNSPVQPIYETDLNNYSTDQLYRLLDQNISKLQQEKLDVRIWQSYIPKAQSAQQDGNETKTRQLLMEAIQSSKERQALFLYYDK